MVNTIIDAIYNLRTIFEQKCISALSEWCENEEIDSMSNDIHVVASGTESWYDHEDGTLVTESLIFMGGDSVHETDNEYNITITLKQSGQIELSYYDDIQFNLGYLMSLLHKKFD